MHKIHLKNKRGKVIAAMQWERPEDLKNWAASMCDKSGFEFRNVDPEVPITLIAIEKPAPKLKLVASEVNAINNQSDVEIAILSVLENLQSEFELLMCKEFINEKTLDEKRDQISVLNNIIDYLEKQRENEEGFKVRLVPKRTDKPLIGLTSLLLSGLKFKNTISIKQAIQ